jgi:hypothetical protein
MQHKKGKKNPGNPMRAISTKEMDQPRFAESALEEEDASHHLTEHTTEHLKGVLRLSKPHFSQFGLFQTRMTLDPLQTSVASSLDEKELRSAAGDYRL